MRSRLRSCVSSRLVATDYQILCCWASLSPAGTLTFFFFNTPAPPEISPLPLPAPLPSPDLQKSPTTPHIYAPSLPSISRTIQTVGRTARSDRHSSTATHGGFLHMSQKRVRYSLISQG